MSSLLVGFMASAVIRATIIMAAGLIAVSAMRRLSAEVRHLAVLISVGACVLLPFVLAFAPRWSVPLLPTTTTLRPSARSPSRSSGVANTVALPARVDQSLVAPTIIDRDHVVRSAERTPDPGSLWRTILLMVWAIGAVAVILRMALGQMRLRRIAARAGEIKDLSWQSLLRAEQARLDIDTPVRLLEEESATTPVTWGVRSPVILLPSARGEWTEARRIAVLRHELVHIARADAHARWLAAAFSSVYWFHPLAWLTVRALRVESEAACDDRVLASGMSAAEYAEHLLAIARATRAEGTSVFLLAGMASQPHIARRIFAVLDDSRRRGVLAPRTRGVAVVAGTAMLLALGACDFVQRGDAREVRSVAGVRRSEHGVTTIVHPTSALARAAQLEVETTPIATTPAEAIGSANDLRYAYRAALLSDGRIAAFRVIDPGVFIFDARGQLERRIGTEGTKPGQFMNPMGMALLTGDTLYLPDDGNGRTNWITADSGFVRTAPFVRGSAPWLDARGQLRGGNIVMGSELLAPELRTGVWRPAMPIALADPERSHVNIVATVPGFEMTQVETRFHGRPRLDRVALRFGRLAHVAAWDTVIAVATGENGYEIEQRNQEGAVIGVIRVEQSRRVTTPEMRAIRIATQLAAIDQPQSERYVDIEETRRQARENPFADSLPPYGGPYGALFATSGGTLWVVDAIAPGDAAWTATAFRSDGAIVGRLHAKLSSSPMYFAEDRVIVRAEDASGRVSLRVHRIVPR